MHVKIKRAGKDFDPMFRGLTPFKEYKFTPLDKETTEGGYIENDFGRPILIFIPNCAHLADGEWELIKPVEE